MKQTQVVQAYIPNWPELGVRKMWPQAMQIPEFGLYMPDDWTSTEKTERRYFYGILCTLAPDFVEDSISGARHDRDNYHRLREQPEEQVDMSQDWGEMLLEEPFESTSKSRLQYFPYDFILFLL